MSFKFGKYAFVATVNVFVSGIRAKIAQILLQVDIAENKNNIRRAKV